MNLKKNIIILVISILIYLLALVTPVNDDTFFGIRLGIDPSNATVSYGSNISSYLVIPNATTGIFYPENQTENNSVFVITNLHNFSVNASVRLSKGLPNNISLYLYSDINSSFLCYQETANVSTSCGGLSTGTYINSGINEIDGDWDTYGAVSASGLYINYTIPPNALNTSQWQYKDESAGIPTVNLSLISCSFISPLQLRIIRGSHLLNYQCYNGSSWITLDTNTVGYYYLYEEAMWWNISVVPFNFKLNASGYLPNLTISLFNQTNVSVLAKIVYVNTSDGSGTVYVRVPKGRNATNATLYYRGVW